MTNDPTRSFHEPFNRRRQIDRICGEFLAAWHLGDEPQIEQFLSRADGVLREELLLELIIEELYLRSDRGDQLDRADYERRFHDDEKVVATAFARGPKDLCPTRIDRFEVKERLGRGASGTVYRAYDPKIDRPVAIKVSRRDRFSSAEAVDLFLAEARAAGNLDHPGIVTIHDFGVDGELVFIVEQYVNGQSLRELIDRHRLADEQIVDLMTQLLEAVSAAHSFGLIHRDLKPANILVDESGKAHVADFGLAIRIQNQFRHRGEISGTPAYMSPEQVRGESHRLSAPSDLWSVGVILYEMLTRRRPFSTEDDSDLFDAIQNNPTPAPRQFDARRPAGLQRICLRCLEKLPSDRYQSATDTLDDLRHWKETPSRDEKSEPASAKVIPKGLRTFDEYDADFFLNLLPGPRDRTGLPESVRFWKQRLESTSLGTTFQVGLLCGSSGCGKSSLIKAGVIPRLAPNVVTIFVECAGDDTEIRLLHQLRAVFPNLTSDNSIPDLFLSIREGNYLSPDQKLVIVLDQFEQWLANQVLDHGSQLVVAMRQCDGTRLQSLLLVREDFWPLTQRFMKLLEVPVDGGHNYAFLDRFDPFHAKNVLQQFGVAYARMSETPSGAELQFLDLAVHQLSDDKGGVVPIHLALFGDMFKDREWTTGGLKEIGGAKGIGVRFLCDNLTDSAAPARNRSHAEAAERVLEHLLPDSGSKLKGGSKPRAELLAASRYQSSPEQFDDLMHILTHELRIVVAVGPDGENVSPDASAQNELQYQLTHDFLVQPIQLWRDRELASTAEGRARLSLREISGVYQSRPTEANLPSRREWRTFSKLTSPELWSPEERMVMEQARRLHTRRFRRWTALSLLAVATVVVTTVLVRGAMQARHASQLVLRLETADLDQVPAIINETSSIRRRIQPILRTRLASSNDNTRQLKYTLALFPLDRTQQDSLIDRMLDPTSDPVVVRIINDALRRYGVNVGRQLEARLAASKDDPRVYLRAACGFAPNERTSDEWASVAENVVEGLLAEPTVYAFSWSRLLSPFAEDLLPNVESRFGTSKDAEVLEIAAVAILQFSRGDLTHIVRLMSAAEDDRHFKSLLELLRTSTAEAIALIHEEIALLESGSEDATQYGERMANLSIAAFLLGDNSTIPRLANDDRAPTDGEQTRRFVPEGRTALVHNLHPARVDANQLVDLYHQVEASHPLRHVILEALVAHVRSEQANQLPDDFIDEVVRVYSKDKDPGVHATADLFLRSADYESLGAIRAELAVAQRPLDRKWLVNSQGQEFTLVRNEEDGYEFAISTKEVTWAQLKVFLNDVGRRIPTNVSDLADNQPVHGVHISTLIAYCQWLSEAEGLTSSDLCYPPDDGATPYPMEPESVTAWIGRLKAGAIDDGAQRVWERYVDRLIRLARHKLGTAPIRVTDEEDVVIDAFDSFFRGIQNRRFAKLEDRDDLWQILVMLTERKTVDHRRRQRAQKRGGGKLRGESAFKVPGQSSSAGNGLQQIPDTGPTPEFAEQSIEELGRLLVVLDEPLRQVAIHKLEGLSNGEIAKNLSVTPRTVERRLSLIRGIWENDLDLDR